MIFLAVLLAMCLPVLFALSRGACLSLHQQERPHCA